MTQTNESFRQFCMRIQRRFEQFLTLAVTEDSNLQNTLVKYLASHSCSPGMRMYLIEHKIAKLSVEEFQDLGVTFQDAHGRPNAKKTIGSSKMDKPNNETCNEELGSAQVWKLSAKRELSTDKVEKLPINDRRKYALERKLCFNCLKPGHRSSWCRSPKRCEKCKKKPHSLLHFEDEKQVSVIASSVQAERSSKVFLMTATAEVRAERRAMGRVFLDYGAQTSFVSSASVKAIKMHKVGTTQISLKGFGSAPVVTSTALRRIKLVGNDGREHEITALERSALDLNIPKIPHAVQKLWEERGVMLSDDSDSQTMDAIHVLIGADYVNLFIHEKKVVDGDVAWKTDFGWVLSGPCQTYSEETKLAQPAHVAFVQTDIQRLWELEEMPVKTLERRLWPAFPIRRKSHSYEVG